MYLSFSCQGSILVKPEYANLKVYTVGTPIMDKMIAREMSLFGLICIVLQMLMLLWVARVGLGE